MTQKTRKGQGGPRNGRRRPLMVTCGLDYDVGGLGVPSFTKIYDGDRVHRKEGKKIQKTCQALFFAPGSVMGYYSLTCRPRKNEKNK